MRDGGGEHLLISSFKALGWLLYILSDEKYGNERYRDEITRYFESQIFIDQVLDN